MKVYIFFSAVVFVAVSMAVSSAFAAPTVTKVNWQKVGTVWDGSYTDELHWSSGAVPGQSEVAVVGISNDGDYTISIPASGFTNRADFSFNTYASCDGGVIVSGRNATWLAAGSEDGTSATHGARPFEMQFCGMQHFYLTPADSIGNQFEFKDFELRLSMTNRCPRTDFFSGSYDFLTPGGVASRSNARLTLFGGYYAGSASYAPQGPYNEIYFHKGASVAAGQLSLPLISPTNCLSLAGVTASFEMIGCPISGEGYQTSYPTYTRISLTDGAVLNTCHFTFGANNISRGWGPTTNKTLQVDVTDGSQMIITYDTTTEKGGLVRFNVTDGSTLWMKRTTRLSSVSSGAVTTLVNIVDSTYKGGETWIGPAVLDPQNPAYAAFSISGQSTIESMSAFNIRNGLLSLIDFKTSYMPTVTGDAAEKSGEGNYNSQLLLDGFTYVPDTQAKATAGLFSGIADARIGSRGYVIDSDYAFSVSQDFADASGETGELILAGTGVKTLSGAATTVSRVVVAEGSATFAAGSSYASTLVVTNGSSVSNVPETGLKGLILGDGTTTGTLPIDFSQTIDVDGELALVNPVLTATAAPSSDVEKTVFLVNVASEVTQAKWRVMPAFFSVPEGEGAVFAVKERADGRLAFTVTVRATQTTDVALESGVKTQSNDVTVASIDIIRMTTGAAAELTEDGVLREGRLEKRGQGKATLTNPSNRFVQGFGLYEGVLAATCPGALGYAGNGIVSTLAGGSLELDFAGDAEPFIAPLELNMAAGDGVQVLNVNGNAEMNAWNAVSGTLVRRGPGRLVVNASEGCRLSANDGGAYDRNNRLDDTKPLTFNADGTYSSGVNAGVTFLEGETVLTGGEFVSPYATAFAGPTMNVTDPGQQVSLVLDGATLDTRSGPRGVAFVTGVKLGVNTPATMDAPCLTLTNGATLLCGNLGAGFNSAGVSAAQPLHARLQADASTLSLVSTFDANRGSYNTFCPVYEFRNRSECQAPNIEFRGVAELRFDNSVLAKNAAHDPMSVLQRLEFTGVTNLFTFANGSLFCCNSVDFWTKDRRGVVPVSLVFDDSEWNPGPGDFTFVSPNQDVLTFAVGRGLVLAPALGATHTWRYLLEGSGGLVKRGDGRVVMNVANASYAGLTVIEAGVLDLDGTTWSGRTFGGMGGTIANGTLERCVVANTNLTYAATVRFVGRHTIDLGGEGAAGDVRVVGHYEGNAPDLSAWRVANGAEDHLGATFTVSDGLIMAKLKVSGLMVIFR